MTTSYYPNQRLEDAFQAAFAEYFAEDPDFTKYSFLQGQTMTEDELPAAIFWCDQAQEEIPGAGVYRGSLAIAVYSLVKKDGSTEEEHDKVMAKVANILSRPDILEGLLNKPAEGEDLREVKGFKFYGFGAQNPKRDYRTASFGDLIDVEVFFTPYD